VRVLYIAKHNSGYNDDEGAISSALTELGCDVVKIKESRAAEMTRRIFQQRDGILLCHKWLDAELIPQLKIPKVFWYFDLVDFNDPSVAHLTRLRTKWMGLATEIMDLGFCTDGDWVNRDTTGKLVCLRQGADSRVMGNEVKPFIKQDIDILFAGEGVGRQRIEFVEEMKKRYGSHFHQVKTNFREDLRSLIARSKIVVAPDSPITDNYWSNRVYMTLGFGGFMLHPYCAELAKDYEDEKEIIFYKSREQLHEMIAYYLKEPKDRDVIRQAAFVRTQREHTYTHRCRLLMHTIQERLF